MLPKKVREFIEFRIQQTDNNTLIAREIAGSFGYEQNIDSLRSLIGKIRKNTNIKKESNPIKNLFIDIESSPNKGWFWRTGKQYIGPDNIIEESKIMCIGYKWGYSDEVHTIWWDKKHDERAMLKKFIKIMGSADQIVGHNGDKFDLKTIRWRSFINEQLVYPKYRTFDTLTKSRSYFNAPSHKLDYLTKSIGLSGKIKHSGMEMWHGVMRDDEKSIKEMDNYLRQDVVALEQLYLAMSPYVDHNTNFAVLKGQPKWACPECASKNVSQVRNYCTPMGAIRVYMKCNSCRKQYKIRNIDFLNYIQER